MVLIISGKTRCVVCGNILHQSEDIVVFPAIISNELDPLYGLNDSVFHSACLLRHPLANEARNRLDQWKARTSSGHKCYICDQPIIAPDDHYGFVHFSADPSHALYEYNFREFHRSCLKSWGDRSCIIKEMARLQDLGLWRGKVLNTLIETLKKYGE